MSDADNLIAFQGAAGAYSDLACRTVHPGMATLPCTTFEDALTAVREGVARLCMIPIDNSVAGRVADIHHLLPHSGLSIVAEHFQRVDHHLLALPQTSIGDLTHLHSHVHALSQCRNLIRDLGVQAVVHSDTAGAARDVAAGGDRSQGAIASELAGRIHGLVSLRANIEDAEHNTTRFLIMAREAVVPDPDQGPMITSFLFKVRSVPAALYKALGGFATNGVNMTKLESYLEGGRFEAAQFYAEVEGHPGHRSVQLAFQELRFFSRDVTVLGVYPASLYRLTEGAAPGA